jgi:hypothetical protein
MKNDLTTGALQHNIGCPISIVLFSTSDEQFGKMMITMSFVGVQILTKQLMARLCS